jgi:hypothetical protein
MPPKPVDQHPAVPAVAEVSNLGSSAGVLSLPWPGQKHQAVENAPNASQTAVGCPVIRHEPVKHASKTKTTTWLWSELTGKIGMAVDVAMDDVDGAVA